MLIRICGMHQKTLVLLTFSIIRILLQLEHAMEYILIKSLTGSIFNM